MKSAKEQKTEGIKIPNRERNAQRKGKSQIPENIESVHHQISGNERKNKANEKISWKQALPQKSDQRNKHTSSPPCKMLGIILKVNKRRTLTKEPEDKKVNDNAQDLTHKRWHRQSICIKIEGGKRFITSEDSVDESIRGLEDYIKKNKEQLITALST